jgi:diacylglycerol kinase (ATP)
MQLPAAIIVNCNAGDLRKDAGLIEHLRTLSSGVPVHVTDDLAALQTVCDSLARARVSVVGVVGGDGTASATLTALWRAWGDAPLPRIALLRGGSMNTVANSLGVRRGSSEQLLPGLLAALRRPELQRVRARRVMRVAEQRLGFLFGTGVWYGYLAETYRDGPPNVPKYVSVLGRLFASAAVNGAMLQRVAKSTPTALQFPDAEWPAQPYLCIAAGVVPDVGFGFKPFPRSFSLDDSFELLAIHGNARALLSALPGLRMGRGLGASCARSTITSFAELRAQTGVVEYSVDGDVDSVEGPLTIGMGPRFEFLL